MNKDAIQMMVSELTYKVELMKIPEELKGQLMAEIIRTAREVRKELKNGTN